MDTLPRRDTTNESLLARGLLLEYATLGWNVIGTVVVIAAAIIARSIALGAFGLDSLIEIFASVIVIWHLREIHFDRERRAMRLIGSAFIVLAAYVLCQAVYTLISVSRPHQSPVGIAWLAATFIAMLLLAWGKGNVGERLSNPVLMTEARVTLVDAYLAGAILVGLFLNAVFGWWWADPLASLVIVYYGVREGWAAFQGA